MLITALTCPDFDLDHLDENVARTVLAAAVTDGDPCDVVGNKDVKFSAGGYNWMVETGSPLVYLAKKDGEPTPTDFDFKIEFEDGKPRVWVEGTNNEPAEMLDSISGKRQYSKYLLRVAVGNAMREYGAKARINAIANFATSRNAIATYALSCSFVSAICEATTSGPWGIAKASLYNIPGCVLAGGLSGWALKTSILSENNPDYERAAMFGMLGTTAGELAQFSFAKKGFYFAKLGIGMTLGKIKYITKKSEYSWTKLEEIIKTLKESPSGLGGVDYAETTVGQILGIQKENLGALAESLDNAGMEEEKKTVKGLINMLNKKVRDVDPKAVAEQYEKVLEIKNKYKKAIKEADAAISLYKAEEEKLELELKQLQNKISSAKSEEEIEALNKKINEIQKEIEDYETLRISKEEELAKLKELESKADSVINKMDDAVNKGDELVKRISGIFARGSRNWGGPSPAGQLDLLRAR